MPYKAKSPCRYPGCNKLATGGYCEEHKKIHNKEYNDWHRGYKSGERYDWKWRKIRAKYRAPISPIKIEFHPFPKFY